ncbi:MAG: isoprenylcysteine carboxylmethyltransferase family protein [Gemmatimonadetes bacterium]|nr:isoprenylcysteine carboxylmethyltransferase family protein [Gemmatimonadota bacterium]
MSNRIQGGRRVLPPVYFLVALLSMVGLHVAFPIRQIIQFPYRYSGVLFVLGGILLVLWAARLFGHAGTPIKPSQEASALVVRGPYRLTRNPMYVGMVGVLFGIAELLGSLSPLLVIPLFVALMDARFIRAEEAALGRIFGAKYADYKARVRRWL